MHEQIARFHILSGHLLCEADPAEFDAFQNTEQLRKVLQSLREMYDDLPGCSRDEAEFRAYYIMTHLQDPTIFKTVLEFPDEIRRADKMRVALEAASCFHQRNYVRYGHLIKSTDYLQACLLHTHLTPMRFRALETMSKAYPNGQLFELAELNRLLVFETLEEARGFLQAHQVSGEESSELIQLTAPVKPAEPVKPWKLSILESKRASLALSDLVVHTTTGPLPIPRQIAKQIATKETLLTATEGIYQSLVDFCVPILSKGIIVDCYNSVVKQICKSMTLKKAVLAKSAFEVTFDSIVKEFLIEVVKSCIVLHSQSIMSRHRSDMSARIFEELSENVLMEQLPSLCFESFSTQMHSIKLKRIHLKRWTETYSARKLQKKFIEHQDNRRTLEKTSSEMLIDGTSRLVHRHLRIIDIDSCFNFSNALVWVTFNVDEVEARFISSRSRVVWEFKKQFPHLTICTPHNIEKTRQFLQNFNVDWAPNIVRFEDLAFAKFENQIPELKDIREDDLRKRFLDVIEKCTCSLEYKKRMLDFVSSSIDYLYSKDPSLVYHPDYRQGAVFLKSLHKIEKQLHSMTCGLDTRAPILSTKPAPSKTLYRVIDLTDTDSPVKKLQRILSESRRSSAAFDSLLSETLYQRE
jgi:hypothetical protein